jgi:hypothetical protein
MKDIAMTNRFIKKFMHQLLDLEERIFRIIAVVKISLWLRPAGSFRAGTLVSRMMS